ncbi:hypothetical protein FQR65_LT18801 [Abscondita terminalis]|nr:hypothetical protein FQR65_LT18801 [Abscondita terminalis]
MTSHRTAIGAVCSVIGACLMQYKRTQIMAEGYTSSAGASRGGTATTTDFGLGRKDPEQTAPRRELGKIAGSNVRDIDVAAGFATNPKYEGRRKLRLLSDHLTKLTGTYCSPTRIVIWVERRNRKAWKQYLQTLAKACSTSSRAATSVFFVDGQNLLSRSAPNVEGLQSAVASICRH